MNKYNITLCLVFLAPDWAFGEINIKNRNLFSKHIEHYQLDEADLHALASSAGNVYGEDITPDNIASISLGASIFTNVGQFNNTPIFDLGALLNDGRLDKQPGSGTESYSINFSTSTKKKTESEKTQSDYSASLQLGGWKAKGGYAQDDAWNKSSVSAASALYAFQVNNNYMKLYPMDGDAYQEWSSYLVGADITEADFNYYVTGCPFNQSSSVGVINLDKVRAYSGAGGTGANTNSPRAHYQAIVLMEKCYAALNNQYNSQTQGSDRDTTLASMYKLSNNINTSIKYFYNKYGEAFVTSARAYRMVKGAVTLSSSTESDNVEWMKSGTLALSYSGWFAGADAKYSLKQLGNTSNAFSIQNVVGSAETIPDLSIDLNSYTTSLVAMVQAAIANSSASTVLPSLQLQSRAPELPDPRPLKDNPYIPTKDDPVLMYEAYKEKLSNVKNDWTNPAEEATDKVGSAIDKIKGYLGEAASNLFSSNDSAQENTEKLVAAVGVQRPGLPKAGQNGEELISNNVQNSLLAASEEQHAKTTLANSKNRSKKPKVLGHGLLKRLKWESKKLRQYGLALKRKERKKNKDTVVTNLATAQDNKIQFPNSRVYGFDASPTSAVLSGLRFSPDLPSDGFKGFPVSAFLMGNLNRYRNVLTYLNFMHSYSISGLKDKDVFDNFSKFMQYFDGFVSDEVTKALASGADMSEETYNSIISGNLSGKLEGGVNSGYDITQTELYKYMGGSPQYKYITALAEIPFIYKTITHGARGYIPLIPGSCKYDDYPNNNHALDSKIKMLRYTAIDNEPVVYDQPPSIFGPGSPAKYQTRFHCSSGKQVDFDTNMIGLYRDASYSPVFPVFKYGAELPDKPRLVFMQVYGNATLIYGYNRTIVPGISLVNSDSGAEHISLSGFQPPVNVAEISDDFLDDFWSHEPGYTYNNVEKDSDYHMGAEWGWSLDFYNSSDSSLENADKNEVLSIHAYSPTCTGQWVDCPEMLLSNSEANYTGMRQGRTPMFSDDGMRSLPLIYTFDALKKKRTTYGDVSSDSTYLFLLPIRNEWLSDAAKSMSFSYGVGSTVESIFAGSGAGQPVNNAYTRAIVQNYVPPPVK